MSPRSFRSYDRYAAIYDRAGQSRFGLGMLDYLNELCAIHGLVPGRHRVLDVACGTGTVALELARRGWIVTGLDHSAAMLEEAARKSRRDKLAVRWTCADMRAFRLPEPVDLAFCFYDSLNHLLSVRDLARCVGCIARALRPGGIFLCDLNTEFKLAEWGNSLERWTAGGIDHLWSTRYNRRRKTVTVTITAYVPRRGTGVYKRLVERYRERAYSAATVRRVMHDAGLEVLAEYRCLTFEAPDPETYRIAYLARRLQAAQ